MHNKPTLVMGASTNPERYSYKAIHALVAHKIPVYAFGIKKGSIGAINFDTEQKQYKNVHTITLYVGPANQVQYYNYIIGLNPLRVIFNPGTENEELELLLKENNIKFIRACTLVMLSVGVY